MDEALKEITVTKTYSMTAWHVAAVKKIAESRGQSDAQVMRDMIEKAYENTFPAIEAATEAGE